MNEIEAREATIIKDTRDLLTDRKQWCKGSSLDSGAAVCVMGAVCKVLGEPVYMHYAPLNPWVLNVRDRITEHLPGGFRSVWVYNDDPHTRHKDILNLLDKCLAGLGALA